MRHERINLFEDGEYSYPHAFGFQPNLRTYFHEDVTIRPCILIVPGGGYTHCAEGEGEIAAKTFYDFGWHTAVLTYTVNLMYMEPLKLQPLREIVRAVKYLRANAEEFHIDTGKVAVMGFSAGAHLSGSLAEFHHLINDPVYPDIDPAPSRLILCYPVISSGEYGHAHSFDALLGKDASAKEREAFSLEKHVPDDLCPVFLWQTAEDKSVPVENSYLMAMALRKKHIPFEHHVFAHGRHGISVSTPAWEACEYGEPYTLEQVYAVLEQIKNGTLVPEDAVYANEQLHKFETRNDPAFRDPLRVHDPEAAAWVGMCRAWLKRSWNEI